MSIQADTNTAIEPRTNERSSTRRQANTGELATRGWTLVRDVPGDGVEELLAQIGKISPQFDGKTTYQVKASDKYKDFRYTQSQNPIGPHTDGPVYYPPPRYLALHCKVQTRCGGGHTLLADGRQLLQRLSEEERIVATSKPINFRAMLDPGSSDERLDGTFPMVSHDGDGEQIIRFSHNLFFYGDLNAHADRDFDPNADRYDPDLKALAIRASAFFDEAAERILIPENAVLIWDNYRMLHAREAYRDPKRELTRFWLRLH